MSLNSINGCYQAFSRILTLNQRRREDDVRTATTKCDGNDVLEGGTNGTSNNTDDPRLEGHRALVRFIEEPFCAQFPLELFECP